LTTTTNGYKYKINFSRVAHLSEPILILLFKLIALYLIL